MSGLPALLICKMAEIGCKVPQMAKIFLPSFQRLCQTKTSLLYLFIIFI